jgi:hypothetical protein
MLSTTLNSLFSRDLEKLKQEISLYNRGEDLWKVAEGITNSGGNLCSHLIGNLNTYIGVGILKKEYIRHRDLEFSLKDIPKSELLSKIDETIDMVTQALKLVSDADMEGMFPMIVWGSPTRMDFTLIHLHSHLNYHLGQINYHRRLISLKH